MYENSFSTSFFFIHPHLFQFLVNDGGIMRVFSGRERAVAAPFQWVSVMRKPRLFLKTRRALSRLLADEGILYISPSAKDIMKTNGMLIYAVLRS